MQVAVLGTDYKNIKLSFLETFSFDPERIKHFVSQIPSHAPVSEFVILSTCNRVELYFCAEDIYEATEWLFAFFADYVGIKAWFIKKNFYFYKQQDCANHLFSTVSGLNSMVFGEQEILGQVKKAYFYNQSLGTTKTYLNKLFQMAIHAGKVVREKTRICEGSYSISSIALQSLKEKYTDLLDQRILIVGSGCMAQRFIKNLQLMGHSEVYISSRNKEKTEVLAAQYGIATHSYLLLKQALYQFDIIYFATSAKQKLLIFDDLKAVVHSLCIVDIGLPRNVEAMISEHKNIDLVSLEDLEKTAKKNVSIRQSAIPYAKHIIQEKIDDYSAWQLFKQEDILTQKYA